MRRVSSRKLKKRQTSKSVKIRKKRGDSIMESRAEASSALHRSVHRTGPESPARSHRSGAWEETQNQVEVRNIECQVHIGVDDKERSTRQRVVVDVALEGIPLPRRESLLSTEIESWVRAYLESGRFVLIEAASLGLARVIFENCPARRVFVRFRKFVLPEVDHVAVEMIFDRHEVASAR